MQHASKRVFALAKGLVVAAFIAILVAPQASGQTGPGWDTLLDGKSMMGEWNRVGETNWRLENGVVVAAGAGYVVPILGNMRRMPGLPPKPQAERMNLTAGRVTGVSECPDA